MSIQRKTRCHACGLEFAYSVKNQSRPHRTVCSQKCRAVLGGRGTARLQYRKESDDPYQPALVERMLDESVAMECAPAWMRHPVPWDHVVYLRARK